MSNSNQALDPGAGRDERIAAGLGWFSLGLGAAQLLAPGALNRLAGVRDDAAARVAQRFVGVRDVGATRKRRSGVNRKLKAMPREVAPCR